jgi:hypothetical protein
MEVLRREASRKKQLLGTIAVVVLCVCVIVAAYVENLNLGEKENDNHLGKLKYDITKADENYTHYMDGEPMVGVTVDENETARISKKAYFNMEYRTEITVMEAPYKNYEDAAANDALFRYRSSHDLSADQLGEGVDCITCGVLESGGAMAWIYTDCGTYTMHAETLMFDDEHCEEELHFFLNGVSVDETLEYETTDL